jgi:quinol monooxygenase YgiN
VPATSWKMLREPEPSREYVLLLTYLPMRRPTRLPRFLGYVRKIQKQLELADGLVGYSLLAKPLSSNYWTLSAWEDDAALRRFVGERPHREAMRELPRYLSGFRTIRWTAAGQTLPPSWGEALARA